jgi:hypothetical protein
VLTLSIVTSNNTITAGSPMDVSILLQAADGGPVSFGAASVSAVFTPPVGFGEPTTIPATESGTAGLFIAQLPGSATTSAVGVWTVFGEALVPGARPLRSAPINITVIPRIDLSGTLH